MAQTQKQGSAGLTLDAQAGQNLGLVKGSAHIEGGAQYAHDASTKAHKNNKLSLSFETVPELIAPASSELNDGKAWNIGHPKFGDMSRPQDDNYLHSSYPIAVKNNDVPAFGRLIATKDCDSYGYDVMLRVNLNWLNEGVNGNTDLCARLAQLQQLSGYEQDAVGQWIILQKGRLRVMAAHSEKADSNAMDQTNQRNTFKAEIEEIIQSSEDKSLSALARLIHAQTDMPIDTVFYGVDLQGCLCTEDEIILLNLDPVTHQGATLVTGQEIKEYSRDPAGFEARRAFEATYQQDLEDWKTGPFDGGIYSDGNTYSAEDAQKAFGKAVEHIKLAFDAAKQTLDLSGNFEERSPLTRLPRSIAHCTAIRDLNLSNTKITSLELIKNMVGMQTLVFDNTGITSLELNKNMVGMQHLSLLNTKITSLEPIKDMVGMQRLFLSGTKITSLQPIKNMVLMKVLSLSNTEITSLEPIKNMARMQSLSLDNTKITSLEPIKNIAGMQILSLSRTKITSLELIKNMAGMQILELRGTEIADLGPIADLIRGGLVMTGVDDDRISAIKAATGGDPLAGDPLSRDEG